MLFLQSKVFSRCLIRPTSSLQSKFPFSSSINSMKDTLIPKKLTKPIKKSTQKTTTATSIIKRKFKTIAKVNPRANPSSTIPESDFRDDDDDNDLNPSSSLSTFFEKWPILSPDFYQIDALDLAPLLLGKYLRRDDVVLQITEVNYFIYFCIPAILERDALPLFFLDLIYRWKLIGQMIQLATVDLA